MNRKIAVLTVAAIALAALVVQSRCVSHKRYPRIEFGETTQGYGELTLADNAIPANMPTELTMYKVNSPQSKKSLVLRIFKALPLPPGPKTDAKMRMVEQAPEVFRDENGEWGGSVGDWSVTMWDGGQFSISDRGAEECSRSSQEDISYKPPTDDEARRAADAFITRLKPFLPDVQFRRVSIGREITRGSGDKPGDRVVLALNVSYSAKMDNVPLGGGPLGVQVASGGKIACLICRVRQVVPDGTAPLLTPQEAFRRLQNREGHLMNGHSISGTVNSVRLQYYLLPPAQNVSHIMPVYAFEGECPSGRNGKPGPWTALLEAVQPDYLGQKPGRGR